MRLHRRTTSVLAVFVAALLAVGALSACSKSSGGGDTIVIGSGNFPETQILGYMYYHALKDAGIDVKIKSNIGQREVYQKALANKEIDLVPEYVSTVAEYWNAELNGKDAPTTNPIASTDPMATDRKLNELIKSKGLEVGPPSPAADQNAFAVTQAYADEHQLVKLSDLTKLNGQMVLGAGPECPTRPFCLPGLEKTYGLKFKEVKKFNASGGADTFNALKDGTIQLGLVFSSDGGVAANNLRVLDDDKHLQQADNIIWMGRSSKLTDQAKKILNKVNAALTTEDLQQLNKQVGVDHANPEKVAQDWLKAHDLG